MNRRSLFLITLCITLSACARQSPTSPPAPGSPAELRSSPTTISTGGRILRLEAALWRDFMPVSPPDGKPLTAIAWVKTADGSPVPDAIVATDIHVVMGESVWSTAAREERPRTETAPAYEVIGRGGPKWGPDVRVDVILRITDGSRAWLLRAPDQKIGATH